MSSSSSARSPSTCEGVEGETGEAHRIAILRAEIEVAWMESSKKLQGAVEEHRRSQERVLSRVLGDCAALQATAAKACGDCAAPRANDAAMASIHRRSHGHRPKALIDSIGYSSDNGVDSGSGCAMDPPSAARASGIMEGTISGELGSLESCGARRTRRALEELADAEAEIFLLRAQPELVVQVEERLDELENMMGPERRSVAVKVEAFVLRWIEWWLGLREPIRLGHLASFVHSSFWESVVSVVIALNAIFMIYVVDWGIANFDQPAKRPLEMRVTERFFLVFFAAELLMKLMVHRIYFFCNDSMRWNTFDFILVLLAIYDELTLVLLDGASEGNMTFLRSLRILRIVRTLRVIRVLRFASQLRRMLQSLMGSLTSLFWSITLLLFIFYLFSLATVQMLTAYLASEEAEHLDELLREKLLIYYGSVLRTMLSFYMATSGGEDWSMFFSPLQKTSWTTAALFLFVVGFTQIALLNILTGVFVESAMKLAQPDRNSMALEQRRADLKDAEELRRFLQQLDIDCSGTISWEEFSRISKDPHVKAVLEVMGLEIRDARLFFDMMGDTDVQEVEFDFLVESCLQMKGPATSIDVQALQFRTQMLARKLEDLSAHLSTTPPKKEPPHKRNPAVPLGWNGPEGFSAGRQSRRESSQLEAEDHAIEPRVVALNFHAVSSAVEDIWDENGTKYRL